MSILKKIENEQIAKLKGDKVIPNFKAGDTVRVHVKIKDGDKFRIQMFVLVAFVVQKCSFYANCLVKRLVLLKIWRQHLLKNRQNNFYYFVFLIRHDFSMADF